MQGKRKGEGEREKGKRAEGRGGGKGGEEEGGGHLSVPAEFSTYTHFQCQVLPSLHPFLFLSW